MSSPVGAMAGLRVVRGREKPGRGRLDPGTGPSRTDSTAQALLRVDLGWHIC